ncbi:hypothetical protein CDAR_298711 [Caerostris darwini]|uniref:Uncharacterized protein n=1 Tax=Caerostris darwini TaxID=1538125 RepID=A0AAV4MUN1_9ARAC|nr:hypothetical protein CDAR_298711 [Caerostris darwini]
MTTDSCSSSCCCCSCSSSSTSSTGSSPPSTHQFFRFGGIQRLRAKLPVKGHYLIFGARTTSQVLEVFSFQVLEIPFDLPKHIRIAEIVKDKSPVVTRYQLAVEAGVIDRVHRGSVKVVVRKET